MCAWTCTVLHSSAGQLSKKAYKQCKLHHHCPNLFESDWMQTDLQTSPKGVIEIQSYQKRLLTTDGVFELSCVIKATM